jgi:hypothetical protein
MIRRLKKEYESLIEELSLDTDIRYKQFLLQKPRTLVLENLIFDLEHLDSYFNCLGCNQRKPKAFCCSNHDLELTGKDVEILEMIKPELFEAYSRLPILAKKRGGLWKYGENFERTMTQKSSGECIFSVPGGGGCYLHRFALERGMDPLDVKPYICSLYPVVVLIVEDEVVVTTLNDESKRVLDTGGSAIACLTRRGRREDHAIVRSAGILTRMFGPDIYQTLYRAVFPNG